MQGKKTEGCIHSAGGSQNRAKDLPLLDERLPGLVLDSLVPVEAAIVSAATGIGYREARQAVMIGADEKLHLSFALEQFAAKHSSFVRAHEPLFEFVTVFSAVNAAHVDHVFTLAKNSECSDARAETAPPTSDACSKREALVAALVVLAPLVIAVIALIVKGRNN